MADISVLGVTVSVIIGLSLAIYGYVKKRKWEGSILLFLLPILFYFLLHFSMEAYGWAELWRTAPKTTLEMAISVALVDFKVLFTVFLLLSWVYVWKSLKSD